MKIHIVTGSFPPDINPRAFRSYELARQFAICGHDVTVSSLSYTDGYNYADLEKDLGVKIIVIPIYIQSKINQVKNKSQSKFKQLIKELFRYSLAGKLFLYERVVSKRLFIPKDTDLVISVSVPFLTHYSTANYRKRHSSDYVNATFVADSGDPFSTCQQFKIAPYFKLLERRVLASFDYLTIPTPLAIDAYKKLIPLKKIRIIPQGFNFEIRNNFPPISKNEIPHFAYAGVFYEGIRNPVFLFDYLSTLDSNFKFYLFLREKSQFTGQLLETYTDKLKDKIVVRYGLEREKLLIELRKMDFLINIGNTTTVQVPSKIIDYALVDRPYLSFNVKTFDKTIFEEFLKGDYRNADKGPDFENYDIINVSKQFLSLKAE